MDIIDDFVKLTVSICYLIGIVTFIYGLLGFKYNSSNPQQFPISNCFMNVLTGSFFLSMPTVYSVLKRSTLDDSWNESSPLSLEAHTDGLGDFSGSFFGSYMPEETGRAVVGFVYLIGLISFARGLYRLKYVGLNQMNSPSGQGMGGALSHMIGGVLVMNIIDVSCIVGETVGMDQLCLQ